MEIAGLVAELIRLVLTAAVGLVGVFVGARLAERREETQRRHAFVERQLRDFYSPLLGLRAEIQAKSELGARIAREADAAWRELVGRARAGGGPEAIERATAERRGEFNGIIDYDNLQLARELLPLYRRMVDIFRDNMLLVEPETRAYFGALVEFLEIWDRWLGRVLPVEVVERLGHSEEALHPFYEHLRREHDELRQRLTQRGPQPRRQRTMGQANLP